MSNHTDRSVWSPEEVDSLENIDKEIQLVSTSSESNRSQNGSNKNANVTSNCILKTEVEVGGDIKNFSKLSKLHSSCDDLSIWTVENKHEFEFQNDPRISCSTTVANNKQNKSSNSKYDHVQSKIKQYFNNGKSQAEKKTPPKQQPSVISQIPNVKEDYLEQINKQLTKELDEKNAILALLQENYERLLFKYAEAQNRIDELRFKFMTETADSRNSGFQINSNRVDNQTFLHQDEFNTKCDIKCQKAVVAPFMKTEEPGGENTGPPIIKPFSLPLNNNLKLNEKDLIKATTPTDSEGLSSIITSMSGHSKILNSLDEESHKKSNFPKYQTNNFILQENSIINDSFDKVKNWQNSLPPLEQIETPETALYNICPPNNEDYSSSHTKYKNISPKLEEKDFMFSDESCPDSWREDQGYYRNQSKRQDANKVSLRTLSLPATLTNCDEAYKKPHRSLETSAREDEQKAKDVPAGCIIQRRQKRPPLLRCSSLPAYDQDYAKFGSFKNGIYIPPLDLNNVTLSDDESYCQQEYYLNRSKAVTSSSFMTSRGDSIDRSIQTPQSFSSYKATITEENSYSRAPKLTTSKSTSITPERSKALNLNLDSCFSSKYESSRRKTPTSGCIKECRECCTDTTWCNVCGESIAENKSLGFYQNRSNSCESINNGSSATKDSTSRKSKPPFKRSVSFGSESITPKYCLHDSTPKGTVFSRQSQDSLENFELYANNLKARSQVVMKALIAHVNNCTQ